MGQRSAKPGATARAARSLVAFAVAAVLVVSATACAGPLTQSGDDVASDRMNAAADELAVAMASPVSRERSGEYFAAILPTLAPADDGETSIEVVPVSWKGTTNDADGATVIARIAVTVPSHSASSIGDASYEAGRATGCFAFRFERYSTVTAAAVGCPDSAATPPVYTAPPSLPDDARRLVTEVLTEAAESAPTGGTEGALPDPDTVSASLRATFPDSAITIETVLDDGQIVAAVGIPAERDCVVGVLNRHGSVDFPYFDRIWLEPGELGCSTRLVTAPPV